MGQQFIVTFGRIAVKGHGLVNGGGRLDIYTAMGNNRTDLKQLMFSLVVFGPIYGKRRGSQIIRAHNM